MITFDIKQLRAIIPTITGKSIDRYLSSIEDANRWLVDQIVGKALMQKIEADESTLHALASRVIVMKAYLSAIPKLDVLETDNGFAVVDDNVLAPASRDRVNALAQSFATSLTDALEALYIYLEDNEAELWGEAIGSTMCRDSYIATLREYRKYGPFTGDYAAYRNDSTQMRKVIACRIEPKISHALSRRVIDEQRSGSVSDPISRIIDPLCTALVCYVNADLAGGSASLYRAVTYVQEHLEEYPEYAASPEYQKYIERHASKKNGQSILSLI